MSRHWTNPANSREYLVGTAEEAAEICGLSRDRAGAHQYRRMVSKPPKTFEPPPGPITAGGVPLVDPDTRQYLYDLTAVREWNRSRPGRGRYDRSAESTGRQQAGWAKPPSQQAGWAKPPSSSKVHYFPSRQTGRALCARRYEIPARMEVEADSAERTTDRDCKDCRGRRAAEATKEGELAHAG